METQKEPQQSQQSKGQITSNENKVEQLDNMNLLYELMKIRCELIFFNKEKTPIFFNHIKNLFTEEINRFNSFNYQEEHKSYFLKYIERDTRDIDAQADFILNQKTCIYIFLSVMSPSLRQEQITNFENLIEDLQEDEKMNIIPCCILIFFYENAEELNKKADLKIKYPNNIFYVEANMKKLDLKKIETKNQLTMIIKQVVINGYVPSIQEMERPKGALKYNKNTLEYIKTTVGQYLQISDFSSAVNIVEKSISEFYFEEKGRWLEVKGLILYYIDKKKNEILNKPNEYNQGVIDLLDDARVRYKKAKLYENCIYNLYRQSNYYLEYFPEKIKNFDECLIKAYIMLNELNVKDVEYKFVQYLRLSELYKRAKIYKKSNMYFLLSTLTCLENEDTKLMMPYMIKKLINVFNIYDVSSNIIGDFDQFNNIHKWLVLNKRKPVSFFVLNKDENGEEKYEQSFKKKIEAKKKLSVRRNLENISMYTFKIFWKEIQYYINMNIMSFYNTKKDFEHSLIYSLGYLQSMISTIKPESQKLIMDFNVRNSLSTQKKVFLNISKLPLLMRIIPTTSNIRFDVSTNPNKKRKSEIFLYNPWEQNKHINNNFYWTTNSYQQIRIQFYNPLDIELELNKIHILFKGAQPTVYPSSVIIPPKTSLYIATKIRPNEEGTTTIIGVKYEMINTIGIQYCDDNGNGLFYNYENKYIDLAKNFLNAITTKQQLISLSNIKIYPEIPKLNYKLLGNEFLEDKLSLFDNQLHAFQFKLTNVGIYDVDKLTCYVYVYKSNNYKVTLDEINKEVKIEKKGGEYVFNYVYWHKSMYEKIEFKIYYSSKESNEKSLVKDDVLLKQYLYYTNSIETFHTFNIGAVSIKPMIMSSDVQEIALIDKKITYNYTAYFCSNKNYIGFLIENIHESHLDIEIYDDSNNENIQQAIIDGNKSKEISTEIRADSTLKDICIEWQLTDLYNCKGKIILSDIIPYYNVNMWGKFSFNLKHKKMGDKNGESSFEYYKCYFNIKNNQKIAHTGLKFQIYIYQNLSNNQEDNFIYNNLLEDKLYIEGCLSLNINKLESNEIFNYEINIYPLINEEFNVTCILLDKEKKEVYFCPTIINLIA